jgi:CMP-N-acetylneuraminic acid synthetase
VSSNVVAIIPARGGSRGIPRKNVRLLCGKPLIAYTIEAALSSKLIDRVVVSAEDEEIGLISKKIWSRSYQEISEIHGTLEALDRHTPRVTV